MINRERIQQQKKKQKKHIKQASYSNHIDYENHKIKKIIHGDGCYYCERPFIKKSKQKKIKYSIFTDLELI